MCLDQKNAGLKMNAAFSILCFVLHFKPYFTFDCLTVFNPFLMTIGTGACTYTAHKYLFIAINTDIHAAVAEMF